MPSYRRVYVEGGCWFFTVNLESRSSRLLTEHIRALRETVAKVRQRLPFEIDAWVVLSERPTPNPIRSAPPTPLECEEAPKDRDP